MCVLVCVCVCVCVLVCVCVFVCMCVRVCLYCMSVVFACMRCAWERFFGTDALRECTCAFARPCVS